MDPDDLEILSFLGEASLSCGDSTAAMGYAESVLEKVEIDWMPLYLHFFQDTSHLKAIVVKAESLYSTCQVFGICNAIPILNPSLNMLWLSSYEGLGLPLTPTSW